MKIIYLIYNQVKMLISKYWPVLRIKVIKYKKQILILAFLFVIALLIFYYRHSIMEVAVKLVQLVFKLLNYLKNEQASPNSTKNENSKNSNTVYEQTADKTTVFYCYGPEKPRDYDQDIFIVKNNWKDRLHSLFRRRRYPCIKSEWYNPTPYISKKKDYNLYRKPLSWVTSNAINRAVGDPRTGMNSKYGRVQPLEQRIRPIIWACNNRNKCTPFLDHLSPEQIKELNRVTILKNEAGAKIMADFNSRYAALQTKAVKHGEGIAAQYINANRKSHSHKISDELFEQGLARGQEATNAYICELFKNSENNTEAGDCFGMSNSSRFKKLNKERNDNYINEIYIILGYIIKGKK